MEVDVIFSPAFDGKASKAVWVVDTPHNRRWFGAQLGLDPNSAVFSADCYSNLHAAITHSVWTAQDHHPSWSKINVIGAALTTHVTAELDRDGEVSATSTGFHLRRR